MRHLFGQPRERTTGPPPSANGASSFHLFWALPSPGPFAEARAVLRVMRPPAVKRLYFWALQVSFVDNGKDLGVGHTGLQWHPGAPAGAVNWGGYRSDGGGVLPGTGSALPPVDGPHTRHFAWQPARGYKFRIWSPSPGTWRSEVTDLDGGITTVIRDLLVPAGAFANPMVWSEVFANCDDPPTEVRWSGLEVLDGPGRSTQVTSAQVNYQSFADGGCANTESYADGDCFVQVTGMPRARRSAAPTISLPTRSSPPT
jgi:hypothetical protein